MPIGVAKFTTYSLQSLSDSLSRPLTKMLASRKRSHASSSQSTACPSSASDSINCSFSSTSTWDSPIISTRTCSTRRTSFDSIKLEDMSFPSSTPSSTPERYGSGTEFSTMSSMTHDMMSGFHDPNMIYSVDNGKMSSDQNLMAYNNFATYDGHMYESFDSQHSLRIDQPTVDLNLYSPTSGLDSSPVSVDFVVPSQTTFMDSFDMQSPLRPVRPLQFESPASDYATDCSFVNSPGGSMKYFMSPYNDHESCTTPSRPSTLRQPMFEPLQSSAALHRVQTQAQAARHARKRIKRDSIMPNNIRVQKQAKKECPWEGCGGKFQRQEHLKRHEKTHTNTEAFPCQFCQKIFGRSDNLKSHIKLHADPSKKSSRTQYFPEAVKIYDEMSRKPRKGSDSQASAA